MKTRNKSWYFKDRKRNPYITTAELVATDCNATSNTKYVWVTLKLLKPFWKE